MDPSLIKDLVKEHRWVIIRNKNIYHESKYLSLDITKAKNELNWQPRLDIEETVKLTVEWYKNYFLNTNIQHFTRDQIEFFLSK